MTKYIITKFGIANFKAISKFTEVEFNPVTLLIGDKDSGKTSLLSALTTFVDCKESERYLDIQPFYFDKNEKYLDFENVKNKYSNKDSNIEYHFTIARKQGVIERENIVNISSEKYGVLIKFGMDTDRIRLTEAIIKIVFENDVEIKLLHFIREEKRHKLKLNLQYILEINNFYSDIYTSNAEELTGDLVSKDIAKEIIELGYKGFTEDRRYENGIYFPKSLLGVTRYYKYYLEDIFYKKFGEDVSISEYKLANYIIDIVYKFMKSKLNLITEAIDVKHIDCSKLKIEAKILPSKDYVDDIFKEKFIEYTEDKKYDVEAFNILKQMVREYGIAEDISIEGNCTDGYSICITNAGIKTNLANADISHQHIVATLLMVLMNGKFNFCFKGENKMKCFEPNYIPIIIENPEYKLNEEHQVKFTHVILYLSKELNTQIVIETQSKVIIDRFKETVNTKLYYFSRNESEPAKSPEVDGVWRGIHLNSFYKY